MTPTPRGLLSSSERLHLSEEPLARDGSGYADSVARFSVGRNGASVLEPRESAKCMLENPVRGLGGKLRDKADAAGVEIKARVDQAAINIRGEIGGEMRRASGRARNR